MGVYSNIITGKRDRKTSIRNRKMYEEINSDRSRVLYSSAFRRLQSKAQVFSLEKNDAVRSRLTHSLEVSDVGKLIAHKIATKLLEKEELEPELFFPFITLVETSCLMHDIGNPPFGHFGEIAIREWFKEYTPKCLDYSFKNGRIKEYFNHSLIKDFEEFDGNPQGIRICTVLQEPMGKEKFQGFNLTYSQILCSLKYKRCSDESKKYGKKSAYFISEKEKIEGIKKYFGFKIHRRFPLSYIVEAADDIAYCLGDIEDGIEKGIITANDFLKEVEWNTNLLRKLKKIIFTSEYKTPEQKFFKFKTTFTRIMIEECAEEYTINHKELLNGQFESLFDKCTDLSDSLNSIKKFSKHRLYISEETERKEIAGYNIIKGLLDGFEPVLKLSDEEFQKLIDVKINNHDRSDLDYEWRLFNLLPKKYLDAYLILRKKYEKHKYYKAYEWFARAHLIVDFISGMTDRYSLELYQSLSGIKID
jgi:dGTPase